MESAVGSENNHISLRQKFQLFLWKDRELDFEQATTPAPFCHKHVLLGYRIFCLLVAHFLFWMSIVSETYRVFYFFTSWGLFFTMVAFSLLIASHAMQIY